MRTFLRVAQARLLRWLYGGDAFWDAYVEAAPRILQSLEESRNLYRIAARTSRLPGDAAEVGVFRGGSARLIVAALPQRRLHLFDTFRGLPQSDAAADGVLERGRFASSRISVVEFLAGMNIEIHAGMFSQTKRDVSVCQFNFVHLDADLHATTAEAVAFFYPRMVPGGLILVHDYGSKRWPGVQTAVDQYLRAKLHRVIPVGSNQCVIVKP